MARDDPFLVRHNTIPAVAESTAVRAIINRMGIQIVTDFFTQLTLSGFAYHMQAGTEDAGDGMTSTIDDVLVAMVADNSAGNAMIPLLYETTPGVVADTADLAMAMLEVDKDKIRWANDASGTAFVPANLRSDDPNAASGFFRIMEGAGIVTAAKSAVPNSVELARKDFLENELADTIGYPGTWDTVVYSVRTRPMCVLIDASSIVGHFGSAAALMTGYCVLQFAQFSKTLVV